MFLDLRANAFVFIRLCPDSLIVHRRRTGAGECQAIVINLTYTLPKPWRARSGREPCSNLCSVIAFIRSFLVCLVYLQGCWVDKVGSPIYATLKLLGGIEGYIHYRVPQEKRVTK